MPSANKNIAYKENLIIIRKHIYILSKYIMVRKIMKKKHKQHFYGNKKKYISVRFFYNFLIFIIVFLSLFLVMSIYFSAVDYINRSQVIAEKKDMQFMFVDNQWIEHNISEEATDHWASSKWDYLFKDYTTWDIIGTWMVATGNLNASWNINTWNKLNTWSVKSWNINTKLISKLNIKKNTVEKITDIPKKNCLTPRWKIIEHWKSILAYKQRNDVPDICNIQRRVCTDGILWWDFEQKACKTNMPYTYTKEPIISYNEKKINPLMQPGKNVPINKWADFNTQWKLKPTNDADTIWNNSIDTALQSWDKTVPQMETIIPNCISPRGGIVLNGQFVKAYKYKNGFINHTCEVELRPCMQWDLEWNYKNASCKHRDISFEDFMDWYFDKEQPSMKRIIETLNKDIPENEVIIKKWSIRGNLSNLLK